MGGALGLYAPCFGSRSRGLASSIFLYSGCCFSLYLFCLSLPVSAYFFYAAAQIDDIRFILCTVLAVLITFRHHGNIRRLVEGNENRFSK